jgi:hypothetical protein
MSANLAGGKRDSCVDSELLRTSRDSLLSKDSPSTAIAPLPHTHLHTHTLNTRTCTHRECTHLQSAHTFNTPVYVPAHTIEYTRVPWEITSLHTHSIHALTETCAILTRTCTRTHCDYTPGHTHTHSLHPRISPYTCSTRIYTDMPLYHTAWPFTTPTLSPTYLWYTASHAHGTRTWHRGTRTRTCHTHMAHLIRFSSLTWHTLACCPYMAHWKRLQAH